MARKTNRHKRRTYKRSSLTPPMGWKTAAKLLGVSSPHLWMVVNGERESDRLMKRYNALLKGEPKGAGA